MDLFIISRIGPTDYDEYLDAVVCAPNKDEAQRMHPRDGHDITLDPPEKYSSWVNDPAKVRVTHIGMAIKGSKKEVMCSSYHAG